MNKIMEAESCFGCGLNKCLWVSIKFSLFYIQKLKATVQTKKQRAISSSSANACLASDLPFVLPPAGKLPLPHRSSCTVMPVSTSSVPHVQLQAADTSTPRLFYRFNF